MTENIEKFIDELSKSLSAETFVKMRLGNYKGADEHLQKLSTRLVETKKSTRLLFQYRYDTRDVVKNYDFDEGVKIVRDHLNSAFRSGHLFTTENDLQLTIGKNNSRLKSGKPTFRTRPPLGHDRQKATRVDPDSFYLKALGITTDEGKIREKQRDKWKQINKFVEILGSLFEKSQLKDKKSLNIVDMGSGKGYLTFAAYDYFANILPGRDATVSERASGSVPPAVAGGAVSGRDATVSERASGSVPPAVAGGAVSGRNASVNERASGSVPPAVAGGAVSGRNASVNERAELPQAAQSKGKLQKPAQSKGEPITVRMTGVDTNREMVDLCNQIAKAGGFDGLKFVHGTIADHDPGDVDILIALHACDTATDDALYKGITAKAEIIIAAPCCHKEIRPQIKPPEMLAGILKHGIMLERTAETITDGLRSLLLESSGYSTKLFEFVPTEHTPKNNMLVATRNSKHSNTDKIERQIDEIKGLYGIRKQRLESLLKS